jgi:hypothetical protein
MITIHNFENFDQTFFFNFLKKEVEHSTEPAAINMWDDNWQEKNYTLPYILTNTNRFFHQNGQFHIITDNHDIIGCGGVYRSEFNSEFSIAGSRTWVTKTYRNKSILRDSLLSSHKTWSITHNLKAVGLCFNHYNKNLIEIFKRRRLGESLERLTSRKPYHMFFNGLKEVPFSVRIQNTEQYLIYENLDCNFKFDWTAIKWK